MPDASGIHLWLVLWKAYTAMRGHALHNIECLGLGLSDFGVLEILLHKGPQPVNMLGAKLELTSGSISVAIDRLERKKLVERKTDAEDRRTRVVHLTPAGRKLIESAFAKHVDAMDEAASGLCPSEREAAVALLKKLGKHAEAVLPRKGLS